MLRINGSSNPSRADVIDAFARAYDRSEKLYSITMQTDKGPQEVVINSLTYESGGPGMFLIGGFKVANGKFAEPIKGFYDANQRVGTLEILKK